MSGIILFQSKYGATKRYAGWLQKETGFDCIETRTAKVEVIQQYGTIILGGGLYASGIAGLSFLKKHLKALRGKRIVVFCVGASPYEAEAFEQIVAHNRKDLPAGIPCFYCRGAWNPEKMNLVDRNLCKMLQKAVARKDPNDYAPWEKALMAAGSQACDWTDPSYLAPILEAVTRR